MHSPTKRDDIFISRNAVCIFYDVSMVAVLKNEKDCKTDYKYRPTSHGISCCCDTDLMWHHDINTLSALLVLCEENPPSLVHALHQEAVKWNFDDVGLNKQYSCWCFETQCGATHQWQVIWMIHSGEMKLYHMYNVSFFWNCAQLWYYAHPWRSRGWYQLVMYL